MSHLFHCTTNSSTVVRIKLRVSYVRFLFSPLEDRISRKEVVNFMRLGGDDQERLPGSRLSSLRASRMHLSLSPGGLLYASKASLWDPRWLKKVYALFPFG